MQITDFTPVPALTGGLLIGSAATLYLYADGRYAGISGMARNVAFADDSDRPLDVLFLIGLIVGGLMWTAIRHDTGAAHLQIPLWLVGIGGLLVGAGTTLGRGCTSGHGVCGLGRFSAVSLVAVIAFIATGCLTVYVVRHVLGLA